MLQKCLKLKYLYDFTSVEFKMQFVKQSITLPVKNIDSANKKKSKRKHSKLLPNSIRCIICGPSNCGKTNVLISLIENSNGLRFENDYIYSKSLEQEKYKYLESILKPIKGLGYHTFNTSDEVIEPNEAKPNSIFIFDDVICDKQNNIKSYFCMGRHRGIDCFYLTQTYTRVPKHLIRDNANFIILFKQDDLNLKHIYNDYAIACDMKFEQFRNICNICWKEKYNFVVIDLDSEVNNGRYRKGFDNFIQIYKE